MEHIIGTIREFQLSNFTVVVDALEDFDVDLSFDEDGSIRRDLEAGNLVSFTARARVLDSDGRELASDYLGSCIYKTIDGFMNHRACGAQNRNRVKREGRFQIYRKNRPYENILSSSDKLRKRGFATKERAENWARINAAEDFQVFESAKCGSYFTDMVHNVCSEARLALAKIQTVHVRTERLLA
jgi:hypothetical protein